MVRSISLGMKANNTYYSLFFSRIISHNWKYGKYWKYWKHGFYLEKKHLSREIHTFPSNRTSLYLFTDIASDMYVVLVLLVELEGRIFFKTYDH